LPDEASYFKEQAERCEKLAREVDDPTIRERLLNLATEYARRAEKKPVQPRRRQSPRPERR
jgi:DNA primase